MNFPAEKPDDLQFYVKLMTEHQANLRAFIVSLMPGSPDVADVLQETNAALWQKRGKYKEGTNFIAWAFQIARYEVYRQRDRTKRHDRLLFSLKVVQALAEENESMMSEDKLYVALDDCLAKLSEKQRELLGLATPQVSPSKNSPSAPGGPREACGSPCCGCAKRLRPAWKEPLPNSPHDSSRPPVSDAAHARQ